MKIKEYIKKGASLYDGVINLGMGWKYRQALDLIKRQEAILVDFKPSSYDIKRQLRIKEKQKGISYKGKTIPLTKSNALCIIQIRDAFNVDDIKQTVMYIDNGDKLKLNKKEFLQMSESFLKGRNTIFNK